MYGGVPRSLSYDVPSQIKHFGIVGHWHWDFVGNTHVWSPGLYPILGLPDGLIRPDYTLLFRLIHPDDCPRTMEPDFVRQSDTVPPSIFRIVRPDSGICTVMSRVEVTTTPNGRPLSAHGILADISVPAMLARAEAAQRQRDQAIFDSVRAFTSTTHTFPFTKFSEKWLDLVGLPESELLQDPARPFLRGEGAPWSARIGGMYASNHASYLLPDLRLANGDTVRYRLLVAPLLNDAGQIESWTHFIGPIQLRIRPTGRLLLGLEQSLEAGHIRAARALLDWSMADLSGASGVSLSTIRRLEGCIASVSVANRNQVVGALRNAGIVFSLMGGATIAVSKGRQIAG
ncbi:hypothetical protein ASF32_02620 [Methylobacterium sp. Leaf91]|nr:hypothetical protein ASF32_02620 [Methylobacterium sp. Leaf91]